MCGQVQKLLGCKYVYSGSSSKEWRVCKECCCRKKRMDGPFALGKREDGMQENWFFLPYSARPALWFSSFEWNKGFIASYQVWLYTFLVKWMAAILAYLVILVSNLVIFERWTTKSLTLHLWKKKYRDFEE